MHLILEVLWGGAVARWHLFQYDNISIACDESQWYIWWGKALHDRGAIVCYCIMHNYISVSLKKQVLYLKPLQVCVNKSVVKL